MHVTLQDEHYPTATQCITNQGMFTRECDILQDFDEDTAEAEHDEIEGVVMARTNDALDASGARNTP